ncbi:hypothetical protein ACIGXA_14295 [Streptomyces fildesensis]|uniref:Uncharacterized protein n=1 Tax=Streptomyces fildesensis TaxID=375757 RepID=A0ABW8C8J4_9ACTN
MNYVFCIAIGVIVGFSELVSRYKDEPLRVLSAWGTWFYLVLNGASAALALYLTCVFGLSFGATNPNSRTVVQVLASGLGAMALLRSSFANPKVDGKIKLLGPSAILEAFLHAAEDSVDRRQGVRRARIVAPIMAPISFDLAYKPLVEHCIALMQNMPDAKAQILRKDVQALAKEDIPEVHKTLRLGLKLLNAVGPKMLDEAVKSMGDSIKSPQENSTHS